MEIGRWVHIGDGNAIRCHEGSLRIKVSVLRGTRIGRGCVLGAHSVVRGDIPDYAIAVGSPARVVRDRLADYEAKAERRAAIADMDRKAREAVQKILEDS
jgi:serine acetyltransferase